MQFIGPIACQKHNNKKPSNLQSLIILKQSAVPNTQSAETHIFCSNYILSLYPKANSRNSNGKSWKSSGSG